MEDILKEIIEADRIARSKVEAKKSEKYHLDEELKAFEVKTRNEAFDKVNLLIEAKQKDLDLEYLNISKEIQTQLENDKQALLVKFQSNKEVWLEQLMNQIKEEHYE